MKHRFSRHALEQIERRSLNLDDVVRTIESPEKVSEVDGLEVCMRRMEESGKIFLLRVFINRTEDPNLVVTVYKNSKLKKYYETDI